MLMKATPIHLPRPTRSRQPFLRWALLNVLFATGLLAGHLAYTGHIHTAGGVAIAVVLVVYAVASIHAGLAAWRGKSYDSLLNLAIEVCPMIAMLGTISGFLIAFSGDAADVQSRVLGASTGLAATFMGVSATIVLMLIRYVLRPAA